MTSSSEGNQGRLLENEANILREVDDMSAVSILTLWQLVNGHNSHHRLDKHLFYLC